MPLWHYQISSKRIRKAEEFDEALRHLSLDPPTLLPEARCCLCRWM